MSNDNAANLLEKLRTAIENTVASLFSKKADAQVAPAENTDRARLDSLKQSNLARRSGQMAAIKQKHSSYNTAGSRTTSLRDRQKSVLDQSRDRMRRTNRMQSLGDMADQDEIGGHHGGH